MRRSWGKSAEPDPGSASEAGSVKASGGRGWVRPVGWVLGVVGVLLIGFAAGQLWMPRTVVAPDRIVAIDSAEPSVTPASAVTMPDLLGLTMDTVARVIIDAGINAVVETTSAPAAGPEGVVTGQSPAPGAEVTGEVTVTLSEAVLTPDLVGMPIPEARQLVEALGAVVQVTREVDPAVADGTVLSVEPAAGQPLGAVVSVVVADPGDALSLSEIALAERVDCRAVGQSMINGIAVQDSILCAPGDDAATGEWVLSRRVSALEAVVGVADRGSIGEATVRVLGDGSLLAEVKAVYGQSTDLRVDLRDVLRLRIEVLATGGEPSVVLGDARLLGTSEQLAELQASR